MLLILIIFFVPSSFQHTLDIWYNFGEIYIILLNKQMLDVGPLLDIPIYIGNKGKINLVFMTMCVLTGNREHKVQNMFNQLIKYEFHYSTSNYYSTLPFNIILKPNLYIK